MEINRSKSYLVPLLDTEVKIQYPDLLLNSYISDYTISLLYQYSSKTVLTPNGREGFPVYETQLTEHPLFVEKVDLNYGEIPCVLYTFMFPEKYYHDYDAFVAGKYSKFSEDAKRVILRFLMRHYPKEGKLIMKIRQVLYRDERLRKQLAEEFNMYISTELELSSIPDLTKEKYDERTSL